MRRPSTRSVLPLLVVGLAIAALVGGWQTFTWGSPRGLPRVEGGQLALLTSETDVKISLTMELMLEFDQVYPDQAPPVNVQIVINRKESGPFRWAVVLREDVALPLSVDDPSGDAQPRDDRRDFDELWVQGDADRAWYLRNAGPGRPGEPGTRFPNMLGSVVVGESTGDAVRLHIVGPSRGPLLIDTGPAIYTNFPVLGAPGNGAAEDAQKFLSTAQNKTVALSVGEAGMEKVPADLRSFAEQTQWRYPSSYDLTAKLTNQRPSDRLSQADPPPVAPLNWEWRGKDGLLVRATLDQPSWLARAQRLQFAGGVLAGIGGGLAVWALELAFGLAGRRPRNTDNS